MAKKTHTVIWIDGEDGRTDRGKYHESGLYIYKMQHCSEDKVDEVADEFRAKLAEKVEKDARFGSDWIEVHDSEQFRTRR